MRSRRVGISAGVCGAAVLLVWVGWNARGAQPSRFKRPLVNDAAVVVAGLILYWLFLRFHAKLFGVAVVL